MRVLANLLSRCIAALILLQAFAAVAQTTSITTLTVTPTPSYAGQQTTLKASVTGNGPWGGVVTFFDGTATLGAISIDTSGTATLRVSSLGVGVHNLRATYSGDKYNTTSTATVSQSVTSATPSLVLTAPASAAVGQSISLSARFGNAFSPSGYVTFAANSTPVGTATVSAGTAILNTSALGLGSHVLSASYGGDANNQSAASGTQSLTITARANMTWQYGYDPVARPHTGVDPNALTTQLTYDSLGRPTQVQQPANTGTSTLTVTGLGWDLQDAVTRVSDPRGLTTTYTVKGLNTPVQQSSPDTSTSTYAYDAAGRVSTSTDARGKTTTFAYDNLGRMVSASYPTGTATAFVYDGGGSPYDGARGQLTQITDASGSTTYAYDSIGRLTSKTAVVSPRTYTVSYGWGDSGKSLDKLTSIIYPSGTRVNYSYDDYGSVSGITINPVNSNGIGYSTTTTVVLSTVTYAAQNQVSGWKWSSGLDRTIGYDSYGQVISYTLGDPNGAGSTAGSLRTLTRDAAGRITAYTHTNNGNPVASLDQSFAYDDLNRLVSHTLASTSYAYSYDATGNRSSRTIGGTPYTTTISVTSNRLDQAQSPAGTASYAYDAMGNIVGDGTYTFTYNDRGRMATASVPLGTVTYTFNGLGQRVRKFGPNTVVPTSYRYYVYDEAGRTLGEYRTDRYPEYETIYLGDIPVALLKYTGVAMPNQTLTTTVNNIYADHLNTPRVITRHTNILRWRWDTAEAFGATAPDDSTFSQGVFVFNQRFPGQTFDPETGLFQNWHREYDSQVGRYRQSDPIGLEGGINPYLYAEGTPLSQIDPYGLWAIGDPLSQDIVNVVTGFGDGASFGLSRRYREWRDIDGGVDVCSNLYLGGEFVGNTFPAWGRVAYIVRVGSVGRKATTIEAALAASAERNAVKAYFRGPIAKWFRDYKSPADALRQYGDDAEAIGRAAGRSNPYFNALAFTGIYASSLNLGQKAVDCQCRR